MIRTLILAVLLAILVMVARNDPGALPEAGRSAGKAIEAQIDRLANAVSDAAPLSPAKPPPAPEVRAETATGEKPVVKKPDVPRLAAGPGPRAPEVSAMPRPASRADGPAMPAVPRLPVDEVPLDAATPPLAPASAPEPRRSVPPSPPPAAQSTAAKSATPVDETQRTQKAEAYLRNAARILSQTDLPR